MAELRRLFPQVDQVVIESVYQSVQSNFDAACQGFLISLYFISFHFNLTILFYSADRYQLAAAATG